MLPWAMITQPVECKSGPSGLHLHMSNQCMSEGLAVCYDKFICSKLVFRATTLWSVIIVVLSFSLPQNPDIVLKSMNASKVLLWKRSIGKLFQQKDCDVLPQVDARIEIWFSNGDSHSHILCQRIGRLRLVWLLLPADIYLFTGAKDHIFLMRCGDCDCHSMCLNFHTCVQSLPFLLSSHILLFQLSNLQRWLRHMLQVVKVPSNGQCHH